MRAHLLPALLLPTLLVFYALSVTQPPLTLRVDPHVALPPADFRIVARAEPDAANDRIVIEFACEHGFYTSHEIVLMANHPPTQSPFWVKGVRENGQCAILATLQRHDGRTWVAGTATERVQVGTPEDR